MVPPEQQDSEVNPDSLAGTEAKETPEELATQDYVVPLVITGAPALRETLEQRESLDDPSRDEMERRERMEIMAAVETLDLLDPLEPLVLQEALDLKEQLVLLEEMAMVETVLTVRLEGLVTLDRKETAVTLETLDPPELMDLLVHQVDQVPLDEMEQKESEEPMETLDPLDPLEHLEMTVPQDPQDPLAFEEIMARLEITVCLVKMDPLDRKETADLMVPPAAMVTPVPGETPDLLALLVKTELLAKAPLDLLEVPEVTDPLGPEDPPVPQVLTESRE